MALVSLRPAGVTQRVEAGGGDAGFFGFAERQADVDYAEAADEGASLRGEERSFQATDGYGEIGAKGRTVGVITNAAGEIHGNAKALEMIRGLQESAEPR